MPPRRRQSVRARRATAAAALAEEESKRRVRRQVRHRPYPPTKPTIVPTATAAATSHKDDDGDGDAKKDFTEETQVIDATPAAAAAADGEKELRGIVYLAWCPTCRGYKYNPEHIETYMDRPRCKCVRAKVGVDPDDSVPVDAVAAVEAADKVQPSTPPPVHDVAFWMPKTPAAKPKPRRPATLRPKSKSSAAASANDDAGGGSPRD